MSSRRSTPMAVSANRIELLQIAKAVATEKTIDPGIVIVAMEDAIAKAARARYGSETDVWPVCRRPHWRASTSSIPTRGPNAGTGSAVSFRITRLRQWPACSMAVGSSASSATSSSIVPGRSPMWQRATLSAGSPSVPMTGDSRGLMLCPRRAGMAQDSTLYSTRPPFDAPPVLHAKNATRAPVFGPHTGHLCIIRTAIQRIRPRYPAYFPQHPKTGNYALSH